MPEERRSLSDRRARSGPWTIHICEDHGSQECAICGVWDVVTVVRADCEYSAMVAYHQERYDRLRAENEGLREAIQRTAAVYHGIEDGRFSEAMEALEAAAPFDEQEAAARTAAQVAGVRDGEHFGTCSRCDDGRKPCVCGTYSEDR